MCNLCSKTFLLFLSRPVGYAAHVPHMYPIPGVHISTEPSQAFYVKSGFGFPNFLRYTARSDHHHNIHMAKSNKNRQLTQIVSLRMPRTIFIVLGQMCSRASAANPLQFINTIGNRKECPSKI